MAHRPAPRSADRARVVVRATLPPGLAVLLRPVRADPGPGAGVRAPRRQFASTLVKACSRARRRMRGSSAASSRPASARALGAGLGGGVADIALKGDAGRRRRRPIELMLAQLAWTLRQEPSHPGGARLDRWPAGAATGRGERGQRRPGRGVRPDGGAGQLPALRPAARPAGRRPPEALEPWPGRSARRTLRAAPVAGRTSPRPRPRRSPTTARGAACPGQRTRPATSPDRQRRHDLLQPAWDFADRLWLVDRAGGRRPGRVPQAATAAPFRRPGHQR